MSYILVSVKTQLITIYHRGSRTHSVVSQSNILIPPLLPAPTRSEQYAIQPEMEDYMKSNKGSKIPKLCKFTC